MIPADFEYKKALTLEEALASLDGGEGHKLLAGGYSLIPAMKLRLNQPPMLIDIGNISSLKGIKEEGGDIIINAASTHADILNSQLIKDRLPFFNEAANMIGDVQVRNRGTIGGSLAHADPSADWPALVLAAEASIEVASSQGTRSIKASDFFTALFTTQLEENEIITAIRIPAPPDGARSVYLKFEQPASRFAVVGCAVLRLPDKTTHIAFTGVSDFAFRDTAAEQAVSGKELNPHTIDEAVKASVNGVTVLGDNFASEDYRKHLAKVYLKRALETVA